MSHYNSRSWHIFYVSWLWLTETQSTNCHTDLYSSALYLYRTNLQQMLPWGVLYCKVKTLLLCFIYHLTAVGFFNSAAVLPEWNYCWWLINLLAPTLTLMGLQFYFFDRYSQIQDGKERVSKDFVLVKLKERLPNWMHTMGWGGGRRCKNTWVIQSVVSLSTLPFLIIY